MLGDKKKAQQGCAFFMARCLIFSLFAQKIYCTLLDLNHSELEQSALNSTSPF